MIYIVFDLEWNMASGRYEEVGKPRVAKRFAHDTGKKIPSFEIFQIGAVSINENLEILDRFNTKIRPQIYPKINKYVERLTKIDCATLYKAPVFIQAVRDFYYWIWQQLPTQEQEKIAAVQHLSLETVENWDFVALQQALAQAEILFGTWSTSDAPPLISNLNYYDLCGILPANFVDIQRLYDLFSGDTAGTHSVKSAIEHLNIMVQEGYHDALNDAEYTVLIFQALLPALKLAAWDFASLPLPARYLANLHLVETLAHDAQELQAENSTLNSDKLSLPVLSESELMTDKRTITAWMGALNMHASTYRNQEEKKEKHRQLVKQQSYARCFCLNNIDEYLEQRINLLQPEDLSTFISSLSYNPNAGKNKDHNGQYTLVEKGDKE